MRAGVGASWKVPDATHIVLYKKKETGVKSLDGRVACKLGRRARQLWTLRVVAAASAGGE